MTDQNLKKYKSYSGIYPHLAVTNNQNTECGIGAVASWNDKLWYITYPAHAVNGSDDKLYCLDKSMDVIAHPNSVGGTHANRMIHSESNQLSIGLYLIDSKDNVRAISPQALQGRITATARHLTDSENKLYLFTMEEGLYEVDVHSLEFTELIEDKNKEKRKMEMLPGKHGKGAYTGQGRLVYSNNGVGGVLIEWNGEGDPGKRESWTVIDTNKYTEITSSAGIYGSTDDNAALWALGWDEKSILLQLCDSGKWYRYRLPKASYAYDPDHGWFTEWPRIRDIGQEKLLMSMHGMLFEFPRTFSRDNSAGIAPIARHQKMIVDFTNWNDKLVLVADDASVMQNPLLGRSQSNLLFTKFEDLYNMGKPLAWGGVWYNENVTALEPSEPFMGCGFSKRVVHISHESDEPVSYKLEIDVKGTNDWEPLGSYADIIVEPHGYSYYIIPESLSASWFRLVPDKDATSVTAYFQYSNEMPEGDNSLFRSVISADEKKAYSRGILFPKEEEALELAFAADYMDESGNIVGTGYYEVGEDMVVKKLEGTAAKSGEVHNRNKISTDCEIDDSSVIILDENGKRYRLPKSFDSSVDTSTANDYRCIRELVTERNLMNVHGSFYELPREPNGGIIKVKPICTHNRMIYDFASWRGMLVISGNLTDAVDDEHFISSDDGKAGLWFGNIDDLWKFAAPYGEGGPCLNTELKENEPSDPYLMIGYNNKTVQLSHNSEHDVEFSIEVDFMADDTWHIYDRLVVKPGESLDHVFPDGFNAHWVRVSVNKDCKTTAWFTYKN